MKYYVVKKGNKPGIYNTWDECKAQIEGFNGAIYKSFSSLDDANNYFNDIEVKKVFDKPTAYVDGSFNEKTGEYSFGCVFLYNKKEYHFKKKFSKDELSSMRNVAGEIKGAGFIIQYCLNRNIKELVIYHDYEGIAKWYNLEWQAKLYGTQKYQQFAVENKDNIKVSFVKVKSHTNDKYNDLADLLAKEALDLR